MTAPSTEGYASSGRPYVRWWWFAERIRTADIDYQLDWIRESGFGGVEIAWVYPYDATSKNAPKWLGHDWQTAVAYAAAGCVARGLGCDFTLGTLWPFGDSLVGPEDASLTVSGLSSQRLRGTWESAHGVEESYIVNHLDRAAVGSYARRVIDALTPALNAVNEGGTPPALFSDSWEVENEGLWSTGLGDGFAAVHGYRLEPLVDSLLTQPDVACDYYQYRSELVLNEFFRTIARFSRSAGALSRVQCHGAPTDLIAAYACVDVPESEALLFDPPFSAIAASAAVQAGRPVVSAEAFTCMYGWKPRPGPGPEMGRERVEDFKLLADALFAEGVNHIVWHGMPYSPAGSRRRFYATAHIGPDASLAPSLPSLNRYFASCAADLRGGRPVSRLAVYLPLEDEVVAGALAEDRRRPSATYHWEMQYRRFPESLWGYRPIWTSKHFLHRARVVDGGIRLGSTIVSALYVDVDRLSVGALEAILGVAGAGGLVFLARPPRQAGRCSHLRFGSAVSALLACPHVRPAADIAALQPLLRSLSSEHPPFWALDAGDTRRFFFAHPGCRELSYPLDRSIRYADYPCRVELELPIGGRGPARDVLRVALEFQPRESITMEINGKGDVRLVPRDQPTVLGATP